MNILLFSQNLVLDSLSNLSSEIKNKETLIITTQMLFDYEKEKIKEIIPNSKFKLFADFLTDKENSFCDHQSYSNKQCNVFEYYDEIKQKKNELIIEKIKKEFTSYQGYLCSNSLGIDEKVWLNNGFKRIYLNYYYPEKTSVLASIKSVLKKIPLLLGTLRFIKSLFKKNNKKITNDVYVGFYKNKKLIFIGSMNRIAYRTNVEWKKSEEERQNLQNRNFYKKTENVQYLTTLHESSKCNIPDSKDYDFKYIQDGYLPANYSSEYLRFKPQNVEYYTWDTLGKLNFEKFGLPSHIMPFRKKLYLPYPNFKNEIKTILVATSGTGDWTAQKNRSDDDLLLNAFVEIARRFPTINIIYRCHPTWVHPLHNGVNSIKRATEFIALSHLKNIRLSSNIPEENKNSFILSFPRSSLEADLKEADIVFGEHSVSMLDAAFKKIPFASVNLTNRRSLTQSLADLGFPHCTSIDEIANLITNYPTENFSIDFNKACDKYNTMTNQED